MVEQAEIISKGLFVKRILITVLLLFTFIATASAESPVINSHIFTSRQNLDFSDLEDHSHQTFTNGWCVVNYHDTDIKMDLRNLLETKGYPSYQIGVPRTLVLKIPKLQVLKEGSRTTYFAHATIGEVWEDGPIYLRVDGRIVSSLPEEVVYDAFARAYIEKLPKCVVGEKANEVDNGKYMQDEDADDRDADDEDDK